MEDQSDKSKTAFSRREFLNDPLSPSTGSVVAYDGPDPWRSEEWFTFLEVGDCHVRARLHQTPLEGREQFIMKMKLLRTVVDEFIEHLETGKEAPCEAKRTAKCGLGVACFDSALFEPGDFRDDGLSRRE